MKYLSRVLACFQLFELLIQYPVVCALTLSGNPARALRRALIASAWRLITTGFAGFTLPEIDAMYQGALHAGNRVLAQDFLDMRDEYEKKYGQ
jgi:hypothetical protein